jgi:tryptophan-rich sensory protein
VIDATGRRGSVRDALTVLGFVVLVNAVGASATLVGGPDTAWFRSLAKPAIYPPPWVFGVVWTALFSLLGVALFLVWRRGTDRRDVRVALVAFALQFVANLAWTPAFFAAQDLALALGVVLVLWALVVVTVAAFERVDRRAALLLVPYLVWVTFAALLNYRFLQLN